MWRRNKEHPSQNDPTPEAQQTAAEQPTEKAASDETNETDQAVEGLETLDQRFSYMLGNNLVRQFKPGDLKFDESHYARYSRCY